MFSSGRIKLALPIALILGFALLPQVLAVPVGSRDQFTPLPDPPTQEVMEYPKSMVPANPNSSTVYTIALGTGSQAGLSAISSVTMCWYREGGDSTCNGGDGYNPRDNLFMSWNNHDGDFGYSQDPNDWFYVGYVCEPDGCRDNYAANAGSTADYDPNALLMTVSFKYRIANVMRASSDWYVTVVTRDFYDNQTSQTSLLAASVAWFGAVSQRSSIDFYNISNPAAGLNIGAGDYAQFDGPVFEGFYVANGGSDITYQSTSFSYNSGLNTSTLPLQGGLVGSSASAGRVSLDCSPTQYFDLASATRMTATPLRVRTNVFPYGTYMGGNVSDEYNGGWYLFTSCQLQYGGGAPVAGQQYSNTFTVGIGENAP